MSAPETPIPDSDVVDLLSRLIAIPSVNPAFRQPGDPEHWFGEAKLAEFVAKWLRDIGLQVEVDEVSPGRPNVIGRLKGTGGGPRWLWEGHLDTVQVAGMDAPFQPRLEGSRLHGRGAADDKGCLAAFMLALRELADDPPAGDVTFLAAIDEEYQFAGITHHLRRGEAYDLGIAGEPTRLSIVRACKGCVRWHVEVIGKPAHTSKPDEGVDAIALGARLLVRFEEEMQGRKQAHPLLGRPTLVCTGFEAGEGPNTVASRALLRFDYRYLPAEDGMEVWRHFKKAAARFGTTMPRARFVVHEPFIDSSAMDVPEEAAVIAIWGAVCRESGVDPTPVGVPYGSDATKMTNAGISTLIFGPGSIDQAHACDEFVAVGEVTKAARMLARAARAALRGSER
jgi:succinyl-diaminopimelate desuccinylase